LACFFAPLQNTLRACRSQRLSGISLGTVDVLNDI
jgi:hypothetical protein